MMGRPAGPRPLGPLPALAAEGGLDLPHELRIRIPLELHTQLMALRLLRGVTFSDAVEAALEQYFSDNPSPKPGPGSTGPAPLVEA